MVELSSEEEGALRELVEARTDAKSVERFINRRLYVDLSHLEGRNEYGEELRTYFEGFEEQRQVYESLADKGMLSASRPTPRTYWFEDLTSDGRCYFKDKEARERAEEERQRVERAHDWRIALFGILGGLFSGALGSWLADLIREALT